MPAHFTKFIGSLVLSIGLQGCMTALYLADRPPLAVLDEMARRCAKDSGVHWYGPQPEGVDLWLPGEMTLDPADDPQRASLAPYTTYSADAGFFDAGIARAIFVEMRPTSEYYFGPGKNDPAGTYRFRLLDEGDPGCEAWIAFYAARAELGMPSYRRPDGKCVAWDRVEAPDVSMRKNVFIRFDDQSALQRGLFRNGEVLIVGGKERARFTSYWAINPGSSAERRSQWGIEACRHGPVSTPAILGPQDLIGR
jgi:hypothetical protein